ncbi:MAG: hypothetical protein WCH04_16935 [Gammaproteobacteria bacterium]
MRLLEFNKDEGGANPQHARSRTDKGKPVAPVSHANPARPSKPSRIPASAPKVRNTAYPIQGTAIRKPVQHAPIDLELLQQRIGFLERRLQDQSDKTEKLATLKDIDQLRERMNRMENSLEQALYRPPLKMYLRTRAIQFWRQDLPLIGAWLLKLAHSAWQEFQPEWWPQLANAWKESLEKARR